MKKDVYNLTNPQRNIWLTEQFYQNTSINTVCGCFYIKEHVDFVILKEAINKFIKENDSFRIQLKIEGADVCQYIEDYTYLPLETKKVSSYEELSKIEQEMATLKFTLGEFPLFQFTVVELPDKTGGFVISVHHIIADSWTLGLCGKRIGELYYQFKNNQHEEKEYYSYQSYIQAEKDYESSSRFQKDKEFWQSYFSTTPDIVSIPSHKEERGNSTKATRLAFTINKEKMEQIKQYCKECRITLYHFFLSLYGLYINKISHSHDFVIGSPILNRINYQEKSTTGMYVSTMPYRMQPKDEESFLDFCQKTATNSISILKHQRYPYQLILKDVREKDNTLPNLYNILFSYQITTICNEQLPIETYWVANGHSASDIEIHIQDLSASGNINIFYDFREDKFVAKDIEEIQYRILTVLDQVLTNKKLLIKEIEIATKEEQKQILQQFNNTKDNFYLPESIIQEVEKYAKENAEKKAIEEGLRSITYGELQEHVNQLTNYLIKKGIKEHDNIGIVAQKKIETLIGILAILKLNGTYVCIDPEYPNQRIQYILQKSNISFILTTGIKFDFQAEYISINYDSYQEEKKSITQNFHYQKNHNMYIVFTSGSTGNPKPVAVTHKNMMNLIAFEKKHTSIFSKKDRILQFATMSFDVSYQEIFSSLLTGNTLVLIPDEIKKDCRLLTDFIIQKKINILFLPPKYLIYLVEQNNRLEDLCHTLKHVITAGEQLIITEEIKKMIDLGVTLHNHYGPAETHVATTYTINPHHIVRKPSIGKPISNSFVYILDPNKKICPSPIIGEIYISGDCVGNGYFESEELTSQRFIPDPFHENYKMYKTGDLGNFDEEGNIYYVGRTDFQVKVNGYRIEIEEVEKKIIELDYITNVAVVVKKNQLEKNMLIAFIQTNNMEKCETIKRDLQQLLPKYMIPSMFKIVDIFPLNNNGKADKKLMLTKIEEYQNIHNSKEEKITNELEKKLLKAMQKVLQNTAITTQDDFFEIGGDSLNAVAFQVECTKYGLLFNTQEIYDNPTVKLLAVHLENKENEHSQEEIEEINLFPKQVDLSEIKGILVTGTTGFLGVHILSYLIKHTNYHIYCIVREKENENAYKRMQTMYQYYFKENLPAKVHVLAGDLKKENLGLIQENYIDLTKKIGMIIHCAASVKHYGKRKADYESNVLATENLVKLAKENKILFNHISTIGIAGNNLVDTNSCTKDIFSENDLYIGQNYKNNVYLSTKIEAEKHIIHTIKEKQLQANIIRVGNLMNSYKDNIFQKNVTTNAFYQKMKAMINLAIIPEEMQEFSFDLTPVDFCAEAIVKLAFHDSYNHIYHVLNNKELSMKEIAMICQELGRKVNIKPLDKTKELPQEARWLVNDFTLNNHKKIQINSSKTQSILKELGFTWKKIKKEYYQRVFQSIIGGNGHEK